MLSIIPEASSGRTSVTTAITYSLSNHLWAFFSPHLTPLLPSQCSNLYFKVRFWENPTKDHREAVEELRGRGTSTQRVPPYCACVSAPAAVIVEMRVRGGPEVRWCNRCLMGVCSTRQEGLQFIDLKQALGKYLPCADRVLSTPWGSMHLRLTIGKQPLLSLPTLYE